MKRSKGEIIATGGPWQDWFQYALSQTEQEKPKIGFLPTAAGDREKEINPFYTKNQNIISNATHLSLFDDREDKQIKDWITKQDLLIIPGGREEVAKAAWEEEGMIDFIRDFWEEGGIILASEEGAGLLFSTSLDRHGRVFRGYTILEESFCFHYSHLQQKYQKLIADSRISPGYALNRSSGIHFRGRELWRALSFRDFFEVYFINHQGEKVQQTTLLQPE